MHAHSPPPTHTRATTIYIYTYTQNIQTQKNTPALKYALQFVNYQYSQQQPK